MISMGYSEVIMFRAAKSAAWAALVLSTLTAHAESTVDSQLRAAARAGDLAAVTKLLQAGGDPTRSDALLAAVLGGQPRAVDLLLEHGADPNAWSAGRDRLPDGAAASSVLIAAKRGDREMLLDLKRHGADLNAESTARDAVGETPLIVAVRQRDLAAVRMLLECGADANRRSRNGVTALRESIQMKPDDGEFVRALVQKGADLDLKGEDGRSVRDLIHAFGPSSAGEAITQVPQSPAYAEDKALISAVLAYKTNCDQVIPDFAARNNAAYQSWRRARAAAIAGIEADPDFKTVLAYSRQRFQAAKTQNDPAQQEELAMVRRTCETQLISELNGVHTDFFAMGSRMARSIVSAPAVQTKVTVATKRAPSAQGGGMMSQPAPQ